MTDRPTPSRRRVVISAVAALVLLAVLAMWLARTQRTFESRPEGIMGTQTTLTAVARVYRAGRADAALTAAEVALRRVEILMSRHIDASELSRLNAAPAGELVPLSPELLGLLAASQLFTAETNGAFDPTYAPVFALWKKAGETGQLPTDAELTAAKALCGWDKFELLKTGVRKRIDGAAIDLGGIAKGYGIDAAAAAMRRRGIAGGEVNVGGDIYCFGRTDDIGPWPIRVRDPFDTDRMIAQLAIPGGAVCTSGDYERYVVIGGKHYSHIINPRTARPTDAQPSVTVIAPTASAADAWATALSVLGPNGLKILPQNIEAMIVVGTPKQHAFYATPGFAQYLLRPKLPMTTVNKVAP